MAKAKTAPISPITVQAPPSVVDIATLPGLYAGVTGRTVYVSMAQGLLAAKGYSCPITGDYDAATVKAVQRLQIENGLLPDTRISSKEWRLLTA
jgi:peptidoglycan hydrolase-like protein with peptidoglycan-binding domain